MVNTNQGNVGDQQPFVENFEMAIMQFVILNKAQQQGEITKDNLQNVLKGNLQMGTNHLDHCLNLLNQTGHLKQNGNKYVITDDGREDVQKIQHLVLELPQIAQQGGQQKTGMTQQRTTGGGMGTSGSTGSNVTGTQGNVGGSRSNPGQPKGGQGGY